MKKVSRSDILQTSKKKDSDGQETIHPLSSPQHFDTPENRQVRVFISSTFRDMQVERELLVKKIFPELRARCRERRVEFMDVDLRWGITEEQAKRGEVLPVCLAEIENCQPYFIGLLGERYGWVPDRINPDLLETQPWLAEHTKKSITELEILHGVLNNPEMTEHAFCYFRNPAYLNRVSPDLREDLAPVSPKDSERLGNLKSKIRQSRFQITENYPAPKALAERVLEDLWQVIDAKYPPIEEPSQLDRELAEHEAFAYSRLGIYVGRPSYFERLDNHIKSDDPPLVLTGDSGCGKSALISKWARKYRKENPSTSLLLHFVGGTPESTDPTRILTRIMGELKRRFGLTGEIPTETSELCREFPNWLSMPSVKGRFVLVIDGLNQLDDRENAQELGWLPENFPPNVRVILSTVSGPTLDALKRREYPLYQVSPFNKEERRQFIGRYLWEYRKRLNEIQINRIVNASQSENPLYLRVLLDELKVFGIYERLDERIGHYLQAQSPADLYERVLERLEEDYEREYPGLVEKTLALIWAARAGLSEREIMDLLNVPQAVWSPLYLSLKHSLVARSGLLGFFHNYLRQAVKRHYLSSEERRIEAHRHLADYFEKLESKERRVEEFPWQLWQSGEANRLERALSDIGFSRDIRARDEFDLLLFWTFLKSNGEFSTKNTYQSVIEEPRDYTDDLPWVANLFMKTGATEEALALLKEETQIWKELRSADALAGSLNNQGLVQYHSGNLDEAMRLWEEAKQIFKESGSENCLQGLQSCIGNQALVQYDLGNLDEAMRLDKEKERLCREIGNNNGLQISLANQSVIYRDRNNLKEALRLSREAEIICRKIGNKESLQYALHIQADIYYDVDKLKKAMMLYKEIEQMCREIPNGDRFLQASLSGQADIYYDWDNMEESMRLLKEVEEINREAGNFSNLAQSLWDQAIIWYEAYRNLGKAIPLLKEALRLFKEVGMDAEIADLEKLLAELGGED